MTFILCMWLLIAPPIALLAISGGRDTAHGRRRTAGGPDHTVNNA